MPEAIRKHHEQDNPVAFASHGRCSAPWRITFFNNLPAPVVGARRRERLIPALSRHSHEAQNVLCCRRKALRSSSRKLPFNTKPQRCRRLRVPPMEAMRRKRALAKFGERPRAAFYPQPQCCAAASPNRPFEHCAAFPKQEGRLCETLDPS